MGATRGVNWSLLLNGCGYGSVAVYNKLGEPICIVRYGESQAAKTRQDAIRMANFIADAVNEELLTRKPRRDKVSRGGGK